MLTNVVGVLPTWRVHSLGTNSAEINATYPRTASENKSEWRAGGLLEIVKSKNRARVKGGTSVSSAANKNKWKQTNLEAKVQRKVKGTEWLKWAHKKIYKQVVVKKTKTNKKTWDWNQRRTTSTYAEARTRRTEVKWGWGRTGKGIRKNEGETETKECSKLATN